MSAKECNISKKADASTRPRLYNIVQIYIQKQLPRDIHPAFKALRDREEAATILPQIGSTEETVPPLLAEQEQKPSTNQVGVNRNDDDDDDELPLYAASQGRCRARGWLDKVKNCTKMPRVRSGSSRRPLKRTRTRPRVQSTRRILWVRQHIHGKTF